jgi:asparagine synthase (glutamine-hydrolysing)
MPAKWKLNSRVWSDAVSRMAGGARRVVNANSGARLTTSRAEVLATFAAGWLKRRLFPAPGSRGERLATEGSWPNFGWYINHSETLRSFWSEVPEEDRRRLSRYWGHHPWSAPMTQWSRTPLDHLRLLTVLNWFILRREMKSTQAFAD